MEYVNPVEQQLKEAGEHLSLPPPSTRKDLLDLLDVCVLLAFSV